MIGVCAKCRKAFETTEEDACAPGTLCPACYNRAGGKEVWTVAMEAEFHALRRARGGEPFADPEAEGRYQDAKRRRYGARPDDEMRALQLREEDGLLTEADRKVLGH